MFKYNYPDPKRETKIIVQSVSGEILICEWLESIRQWVDTNKPITIATISYLEFDTRISEGHVQWCYMSEFKRFINITQRMNIKEEI